MALFSIGNEEFLEIFPFPFLPVKALEIVERPGIDGSAFFELGSRGQQCTVHTKCDYVNLIDAMNAFERYCTFTWTDPVDIVFLGLSIESGANVKFQVLDVQPIFVGAIAGGVGGINPPSTGWVEALWTLKPVPLPF
jgi:hypothetical protein